MSSERTLMMRRLAITTPFLICIVVGACGGGSAGDAVAPTRLPLLRIVQGNQLSDTIQAKPLQALTVEVRDGTGAPRRGAVVRFDALPHGLANRPYESGILVAKLSSNVFSAFASDSTDVTGRASALLAFGTVAGTQRIVVTVPDAGTQDTATFMVLPGHATHIVIGARDTAAYPSTSYPLAAAPGDRYGNLRPSDSVTYVPGPTIASVSGSGIVTTTSIGRTWVAVKSGAWTDTARVSVVPHGSLLVVYEQASPKPTAIAAIDLDGSNRRLLANVSGVLSGANFFPAWDPAGTQVVYTQTENNYTLHNHVSDATTGVSRYLMTPGSGVIEDAQARYSPDGQWLYFFGRTSVGGTWQLYRIRADGGGTAEQLWSRDLIYASNPLSVSRDGAKLLVGVPAELVTVFDLTARTPRYLNQYGLGPILSPDGSFIVYADMLSLYITNADGTGRRQLSPSSSSFASNMGFGLSPDGQWVAARSSTKIELIRVSDGLDLPLPYSSDMYQPAFHP